VALTCSEATRILVSISKDFRSAHFELYVAPGGASEVQIRKTSFSDPTLDTVANNEARMNALSIAAKRLEACLADLRSAHGLIAGTDQRRQGWSGQELEEAEATARDRNPRGMGKRAAVRSIR
jgi:hypothetical protein